MTWLWTDGTSMSYSPGWINNQPATQTNQNCVVMRDQVDLSFFMKQCSFNYDIFLNHMHWKNTFHLNNFSNIPLFTHLLASTRVLTSASGSMSAVTRPSMTTSTLSVRGKQNAKYQLKYSQFLGFYFTEVFSYFIIHVRVVEIGVDLLLLNPVPGSMESDVRFSNLGLKLLGEVPRVHCELL